MARLYAIGLLAVACSMLATAQGRAVTDMPANFTSAQANAALAHVLQHPSEVQDWLEKVRLPNLVQLKNWVSAFPPASAAQLAAPPQQAPNGQGPPNNGQGPPNGGQGPPNGGQGPPGQAQSFAQQQPAQAQPDAQPQAQAEQGPPQPQGAPQDAGPQGPPQNAGPQGPPGTAAQP